MSQRQRLLLLATLTAGALLRVGATQAPPGPDAVGYLYMARRLSWLDPLAASAREPLWILFVKITTAPFGYRIEAIQALSCLMGVVGLVACVWALQQMGCRGWRIIGAVAAIGVTSRLIDTAGQGTRESTAVLIAVLAAGLAARSPRWLPLLAALALGVRWELGIALMAISVALLIGRVIRLRWLLAGVGAAILLVGPFLVSNAREYGDPLFHSNVHATFYKNLEATRGVVLTEPLVPPEERIHPEIQVPMYRGPLITWADFALDVIGPAELARRQAKAAVVLPVDALRLGWLPWPFGAGLLVAAIVGGVRRRDRVVLTLTGLIAATVLGYGMLLPWFDRRLVSHLAVLLILLICSGSAPQRALLSRSASPGPCCSVPAMRFSGPARTPAGNAPAR